LIVATKTPPEGGDWPPSPYDGPEVAYSPAYLRANVEKRLRTLNTDCIDILQLHTWTRAWNKDPKPFETLRQLQKEGKIRFIGVSTPEHDQNSVVDLIRGGWVDSVQVIYNLFEQEPAAEILPAAKEHGVGIIVRMAFDEGALTGKFSRDTVFPKGDFRADYFRGERLGQVVDRVEKIKADVAGSRFTLTQAALKFATSHPGVSTVIAGIRNVAQAEMNLAVSDLPELLAPLLAKLRTHNWRRAIWYGDNW
jgi:aryl-alcohol dehydrogenase-like predicted oxidoreductase